MNSIYFPVHVVLLLRRIVNVISSLSISNQYLLPGLKSARAEEEAISEVKSANDESDLSWNTLRALRAVEWRWWWTSSEAWNWPRLIVLESVANAANLHRPTLPTGDENSLHISSLALPTWFGRDWAWPSLMSKAFGHPNTSSEVSGSHDNPPPSENHGPKRTHNPPPEVVRKPLDTIHRLLTNPALYDPVRKPRHPIVLCHGLYGFDVRGPSSFPSLRMHYWSNVLSILRDKVGADVIVTSVPGTGSIASRSETLNQQLQDRARGREINLLAHSMGGLDCRHLISHVRPTKYAPLSLTTIGTPHRGSPFMDWCAENIGIGKLREKEELLSTSTLPMPSSALAQQPQPPSPSSSPPKPDMPFSLSLAALPASFTTLLLSMVDSPAYFNLTTPYLTDVFNPSTPDDPRVKYFSVAGRMGSVSVWHPFWLSKMVLDGAEEKARGRLRREWEARAATGTGERDEPAGAPLWAREDEWGNDGLVNVQSARWGEFLGTMEGCDHWEMRGARGLELGVDLKSVPLGINLGSDGWGWREWGKLVGAWKREERRAAAAAAGLVSDGGGPHSGNRVQEQERERVADEARIKSSADKLSAVFDWLVEQPAKLASKGKCEVEVQMSGQAKSGSIEGGDKRGVGMEGEIEEVKEVGRNRNELETKLDLERFYVALSRKMYDEGL